MSRRMSFIGCCLAAAIAVLPATAEAGTAAIVSHYHSSAPTPTGAICPTVPGAVASLAVAGEVTYGDAVGDTMIGTATLRACVYPLPDDTIVYAATEAFTGTIQGCGGTLGSVKLAFAGRISRPNPVTGNRQDTGGWTVVPGTATGGLASVRLGAGNVSGTPTPSLSATGTVTGAVKC